MKKIFLSCILVLVGLVCFAQKGDSTQHKKRTPEERADRLTAWMAKTVNLTGDQKAKVATINLKYAKLNQEKKTEDQGNRSSMMSDFKANEAERDAELKGVLTVDQFQTYTAAKQQMAEKRKGRRGSN